MTGEPTTRLISPPRVRTTCDLGEIRPLSTYFKLKVQAPETVTVEGKQTKVYRGFGVGSFPRFKVVLRHEKDLLIEFEVWNSCIGAPELFAGSVHFVDRQALAPFFAKIMQMIREQSAHQVPDPTRRTPPAKAGDCPAARYGPSRTLSV